MKRMYKTPECWWSGGVRKVHIFCAEKPGRVFMALQGETTDVDEFAKWIIERNNKKIDEQNKETFR